MKADKEKKDSTIKVSPTIKNLVAKFVAGTPDTIGGFYDKAAEEKLKIIKFGSKEFIEMMQKINKRKL